MSITCNAISSASSYNWCQRGDMHNNNPWIVSEEFYTQITSGADVLLDNHHTTRIDDEVSKPLREKNSRKNGKYTHVPHRDKPPQVVAKRNARERRRVQAVNSAFMRLRKAVPFENHRGKRVSKVKTLQNAIEYIKNLQELLKKDGYYESIFPSHYYNLQNDIILDQFDFEDRDEDFY